MLLHSIETNCWRLIKCTAYFGSNNSKQFTQNHSKYVWHQDLLEIITMTILITVWLFQQTSLLGENIQNMQSKTSYKMCFEMTHVPFKHKTMNEWQENVCLIHHWNNSIGTINMKQFQRFCETKSCKTWCNFPKI